MGGKRALWETHLPQEGHRHVCQYTDADSARRAVTGLLREISSNPLHRSSLPMTVAEVCDHFIQRELTQDNTWRSYSTKKAYKAHLKRWIIPHWGTALLSEVRTMGVESWLRWLPLAKSSCAKIRGLLSVLFNHACRYELYARNPIRLVRQGAKRRSTPSVLTPAEIKALFSGLGLRERVLVLLVASTGLRQNELFGLKWGDVDFAQNTMSVVRSVVYGVVGPCKTGFFVRSPPPLPKPLTNGSGPVRSCRVTETKRAVNEGLWLFWWLSNLQFPIIFLKYEEGFFLLTVV